MEQYEYKLMKYDGKGLFGGKFDLTEVDAEFNKMGKEGWELVSLMDTQEGYGKTKWIIATFKRVVK